MSNEPTLPPVPATDNPATIDHVDAGEATLPPLPPSDAATTAGTDVPGYEILAELGRGGMGVVYKARHLGLNRVVALKMILSGGHASSTDLVRFLTEAQAVAGLQHTNIVQLFGSGTHNGLPFFTLEFVEGGSLSRKVKDAPLTATDAARIVEALARGMAYAHSKGLVHRDLKPDNVLLAPDGTPKITDFGLAKRLANPDRQVGGASGGAGADGLTQTGAIMGTPSYMAPEQAAGKAKDVGPLADVWSLGAVLYRLVTGRPPFQAATVIDTVMQVVSEEPVPPSQLAAKLPKDVETIILKCLQKEPSKRYASAEALADDLGRYLRGEPIVARPVGRVERTVKWMRRNPTMTAFVATLVVGVAVSAGLAVWARSNAETARRREADAVAARDDLAKANDKLTASQAELEQSTDELRTSVARNLLRPLALGAKPDQPLPPLNQAEIDALWELAASKDRRLGSRFVEDALRTPTATRQLKGRAAVGIQSAVSLHEEKRRYVEALLSERLRNPTSPADQVDIALIVAQSSIGDRAILKHATDVLLEAMTKTTNPYASITLSEGLSSVAARLDPKDAAALITHAMSKTSDPNALDTLSRGLSSVAARMEPKDAAASCGQAAILLTQAMTTTKTTNSSALFSLSRGLSTVAARMEPKDAAALLTQTMTKTTNSYALFSLSEDLSSVAARMEPKDAAASCRQAAASLRAYASNLAHILVGKLISSSQSTYDSPRNA